MGKRTPQRKAAQKFRTERNKLKPQKKKKIAREEVVNRKLKAKQIKRNKFLIHANIK